jgi:hypothetical protein
MSADEHLPGHVLDTGPDPMERQPVVPKWLLRSLALVAVLAASSVLLSAVLFASNRHLNTDNCRRIHAVVSTLDQILINGRVSATRYERDGTITRAQLRLALRDNDVARSKLYRADCPPGSAPPLK